MDGRFDLPLPDGTCYLALDPASALRERVGARLSALRMLPADDVDTTVVSLLHVPADRQLADASDESAAGFGVTRELVTVTPYDIPQQWARKLRTDGMRGIRYESRFSTASRPTAVAIFDDGGVAGWPVDPSPRTGRDVAGEAGVRVLPRPRTRGLRIASPPDRQPGEDSAG